MVHFICRRGKICGEASQEVILYIGVNKDVTVEEIFLVVSMRDLGETEAYFLPSARHIKRELPHRKEYH
jgi:hypothetical protein